MSHVNEDAYQRAQQAISEGEPLKAAEQLREWLIDHPRDHRGWLHLIDALLAGFQFQEALKTCQQALSSFTTEKPLDDPSGQSADILPASQLEQNSQPQPALPTRPSEPSRTAAQILLRRAWLLRTLRRFSEAETALQQAIRLDPLEIDYPEFLVELQVLRSDWPAVLETTNRILQLQPDRLQALAARSLAFQATGLLEQAEQVNQDALRHHPEAVESHVMQGDLLLARGETSQALQQFGEAVRRDPESWSARMSLERALAAVMPVTVSITGATHTLSWTAVLLSFAPLLLQKWFGTLTFVLALLLACPAYVILTASLGSEHPITVLLQWVVWAYAGLIAACWACRWLVQLPRLILPRGQPEEVARLAQGDPAIGKVLAEILRRDHPAGYLIALGAVGLAAVDLWQGLTDRPDYLLDRVAVYLAWCTLLVLPWGHPSLPTHLRTLLVAVGFGLAAAGLTVLGSPAVDRAFSGHALLSAVAGYCFYLVMLPLTIRVLPSLVSRDSKRRSAEPPFGRNLARGKVT